MPRKRHTPLVLSKIPFNRVSLFASYQIVCPRCDRWRRLERRRIHEHRIYLGGRGDRRRYVTCGGSNRRVRFDISAEEWCRRAVEAMQDAARVRAVRVARKPRRAPVPAPMQMAAARAAGPAAWDAAEYREHVRDRAAAARQESRRLVDEARTAGRDPWTDPAVTAARDVSRVRGRQVRELSDAERRARLTALASFERERAAAAVVVTSAAYGEAIADARAAGQDPRVDPGVQRLRGELVGLWEQALRAGCTGAGVRSRVRELYQLVS